MLASIRSGNVSRGIIRQVYHEWISYGLLYDLGGIRELEKQDSRFIVRPFEMRDTAELLTGDLVNAGCDERREVLRRYALLAENIPSCYVVEDSVEGEPVFMQWLITNEYNDAMQKFFMGRFPRLSAGEALLENAYIPRRHRGKGIMSRALCAVVAHAKKIEDLRWLVTFVDKHNAASLKGCLKAGFYPFATRRDVHMCFHRLRWREFF